MKFRRKVWSPVVCLIRYSRCISTGIEAEERGQERPMAGIFWKWTRSNTVPHYCIGVIIGEGLPEVSILRLLGLVITGIVDAGAHTYCSDVGYFSTRIYVLPSFVERLRR